KVYAAGRRARQLLDAAREAVAAALGVRPDEVSFTSSGTAACHAAVLGGLAGRSRAGDVLVHSAIEHSAVLHAAARHTAAGGSAVAVPCDRLGRLELDAWRSAVTRPGVGLAALISASHEVGTRQPVTDAAAACAAASVPLFVDAGASLGRVPVPDGWSLLAGSAHKRSEEHTSELQSRENLVCRLLLEKKKKHESSTDKLHNLRARRILQAMVEKMP